MIVKILSDINFFYSGLANFAGSICKKYNVELAGLMQYVTNQLKAGKRLVNFISVFI